MLAPHGAFVSLVKPQFEAQAHEVGEGGIVRDPKVHARVLAQTIDLFVAHGLYPVDICASPIHGAKGNREFFIYGDRVRFNDSSSDDVRLQVSRLKEKSEEL